MSFNKAITVAAAVIIASTLHNMIISIRRYFIQVVREMVPENHSSQIQAINHFHGDYMYSKVASIEQ